MSDDIEVDGDFFAAVWSTVPTRREPLGNCALDGCETPRTSRQSVWCADHQRASRVNGSPYGAGRGMREKGCAVCGSWMRPGRVTACSDACYLRYAEQVQREATRSRQVK